MKNNIGISKEGEELNKTFEALYTSFVSIYRIKHGSNKTEKHFSFYSSPMSREKLVQAFEELAENYKKY